MQFDKTRIAIRERDYPDILDLALQLIRREFKPWLIASSALAIPLAILNAWLIGGLAHSSGPLDWTGYTMKMFALVGFEAPFAGALVTRFLGHALFIDAPPPRLVIRDVVDSTFQLALYQLALRGLFFAPALLAPPDWTLTWLCLIAWIPYVFFPFIGEIILLERNPLRSSRKKDSTWKRSRDFHKGIRGDQMGRGLVALLIAVTMTFGASLGLWYLRGTFSNRWDLAHAMFTVCLPAGLWIVFAFFTVVRYLCYLDLRIRREGWEVELLMRAEAERLARQIG